VPHAEILEFVKPALAKEGVDLKVKVFTDYIQPNVQVAEKRLDANFFQHQPYLDEFNKAKGTTWWRGACTWSRWAPTRARSRS
jgi:D-methionine transport system substrate-binding protein